MLTPAQRAQQARAAVLASWANTPDPTARTAPGRAAFLSRFERAVDPEGQLPERERARRAEHARRSYFARLALRSSRARAARKGAADATP